MRVASALGAALVSISLHCLPFSIEEFQSTLVSIDDLANGQLKDGCHAREEKGPWGLRDTALLL